jgi:ribosomal protein S18 acetylase RimI-like enzyme
VTHTRCDIVAFRDEHSAAFYALNRAWLDEHELYEPPDEAQLTDPEGTILALGGVIYVALEGTGVVGTAALIPHGPGEMELVKLAVHPSARGRGIARRLTEICLAHARREGARRIVLVSNSRLTAALRLYESVGFVHRPVPDTVPYQTADVYMELELLSAE